MRQYQHHPLVRNRQRNFSYTFTWFTRERRRSSGHKLILPPRVIPYLKAHFTSSFLVLKSRNRRLQLARMGIKSCAQRDKGLCVVKGEENLISHSKFPCGGCPSGKPPLLSGSDAQALRFLKIFADEVHIPDNVAKNPPSHLVPGSITKQNVLQHYANIFAPGCGKPLGNPLRIEMDPSVTPVHAPRRRIPVYKFDKVNEELSRLCDNGTIKPVTQPTDWLSNILVKEKPDGNIRICIDPSQTTNKAICRLVYTIPTIEEKLPLLKNAKLFTIVDVSEAFHTIELDDESALLTTFMGPDGL